MKRILKIIVLVLVLLFIAIQFVPVDRTNPPVRQEIQWSSPAVGDVVRRACYDCHSNETVWPWYAYVAPISWRVADHVEHGRRHLNFSEWNVDQEDLDHALKSVKSGEMPLNDYLWLHPEAQLGPEDLAIFVNGVTASYKADPPGQ